MDKPQWLQLAIDLGPAVAAVVGGILAFLWSVFMLAARWAWKRHQEKMQEHTDALTAVAKAHESLKGALSAALEINHAEHERVRKHIDALRAEIHLGKTESQALKGGLLNLEGAIKQQQNVINSYVEKMGEINGKFSAIFKFIDAPRRATDSVPG